MFFGLIKRNGGGNNVHEAAISAAAEAPSARDKYRHDYVLWQPKLQRMSDAMITISKDIEDEFLTVGESIQKFTATCNEITRLAEGIGHMIEGGGGGFNSGSFGGIFEKAYEEIESCCDVISDRVNCLCALAPRMEDILMLGQFLEKLSRSVTIIGTLIRIEKTRVNDAGFDAMTAAIDEIAVQIARNNEKLASASKAAKSGMEAINDKMAAGRRKIHDELSFTRNRLSGIIEEMETMTSQARQACLRMEGRSSQISSEIGEVVVALQYHDICRQQMQHVSEALRDIAAKIARMDDMEAPERATFGHWITEAVGIQILQLEHAVSQTVDAAGGISGHLERVSGLSGAQQEDAATILEDEEAGSDKIVRISSELEMLSGLMTDGRNMMVATIDDISKVNAMVGGMSAQVGEVDLISDNINILALNAILKVGRTGEAGRGLGVLADEIRKLSNRAGEQINRGSGALNRILESSSELGATLSEEMNRRLSSIEEVFQKTGDAVAALLLADESLIKSMAEITDITKRLENEIKQVVSGIRFDSVVKSGVGVVVSELRDMLREVEAVLPELSPEAVERMSVDLDEIKNRYTIHSERKIHESRSASGIKEVAGGGVEFF